MHREVALFSPNGAIGRDTASIRFSVPKSLLLFTIRSGVLSHGMAVLIEHILGYVVCALLLVAFASKEEEVVSSFVLGAERHSVDYDTTVFSKVVQMS